jgi:hypothetical protein
MHKYCEQNHCQPDESGLSSAGASLTCDLIDSKDVSQVTALRSAISLCWMQEQATLPARTTAATTATIRKRRKHSEWLSVAGELWG